ncbi:MAG: ATP-binding cassette domain-containing protein [Aigarchaeota archaeon]|nr:ATP-binding cassette domain-containing protein [Aigarchaeota archaeon]MDW8092757.1 ATP-binding cassette domain-containing protein [Nitrososphaerota archaeon]
MIAASLRGLSYYERQRGVLSDINLDFFEEEVSCIVSEGEEGAVLLRLLAGILKPSSGSVYLFGKPPDPEVLRTGRLVFLPRGATTPFNVNVRQYLTRRLSERGVDKNKSDEIVQRLLGELGITHLIDAKTSVLSEGERRVLTIVTELLHLPKLVLIEEPTHQLPFRYRWFVMEKLRRFSKTVGSVIVSSTDLGVIGWSDRISLLKDGQVVASGNVNELIKRLGGGAHVVISTTDKKRSVDLLGRLGYVKRIGIDKDGSIHVWLEDFDKNLTDLLQVIYLYPLPVERISIAGTDTSKELERILTKLFSGAPP